MSLSIFVDFLNSSWAYGYLETLVLVQSLKLSKIMSGQYLISQLLEKRGCTGGVKYNGLELEIGELSSNFSSLY